MRQSDIKAGGVYIFTNMHGEGLGRCIHHSDGVVTVIRPLPVPPRIAFCALSEDGSVIECYADELSCQTHAAGTTVSFGDYIRPGTLLKCIDAYGAEQYLYEGSVYTFSRWENQYTLGVEEIPPEHISGGFKPERFVYA